MVEIQRWSATQAQTALDSLITLLQDAVHNGASIGFIPPLTHETAAAYWQKISSELPEGNRLLFVALEGGELIGAAQLALEPRQNGRHRAEVQKVIVHTRYRQRGIGQQLMLALEEAAQQHHRTLLVLDTRHGDAGEHLYQKVGYIVAGIIPQYASNGEGGFDDTVYYYKLLTPTLTLPRLGLPLPTSLR